MIRHLLIDGGLSVAVNWMLNPNQGQPNPSRTKYLKEPRQWGKYDPLVFDYLADQVLGHGIRNVSAMSTGSPIEACTFYSSSVPTGGQQRDVWHNEFLAKANGCSVVFYDPDTGIERKSSTGAKRRKFVLWDELCDALHSGFTLLIYQHRPQDQTPNCGAEDRAVEIQTRLKTNNVLAVYNGVVIFFIVANSGHLDSVDRAFASVQNDWRHWPVSLIRL